MIDQKKKQEEVMKSSSVATGSRYASSRHRITNPPAFHACGESRVVVVTEHRISVPLRRDSTDLELEEIDLFFTIAELLNDSNEDFFHTEAMMKGTAEDRALAYVRHFMLQDMDDSILYLQGGPGFGAPTPACGIGLSSGSSWAGEALGKGFKHVVLMDQRGTGRSTPITKQTLQKKFPDLFALDANASSRFAEGKDIPSSFESFHENEPELAVKGAAALKAATEYMTNFRADNIVIDAEAIREALLVPAGTSETPRPWGAALGQVCCLCTNDDRYFHYLLYLPCLIILTSAAPSLIELRRVLYDVLFIFDSSTTTCMLAHWRYRPDVNVSG